MRKSLILRAATFFAESLLILLLSISWSGMRTVILLKKRLKLLQETASNARREPMKERGLDMVCLAEDSGASKWPKAIDLLI